MIHAKNYETVSTSVRAMQRKPVASFSGHGVYSLRTPYIDATIHYQYFSIGKLNCKAISLLHRNEVKEPQTCALNLNAHKKAVTP